MREDSGRLTKGTVELKVPKVLKEMVELSALRNSVKVWRARRSRMIWEDFQRFRRR